MVHFTAGSPHLIVWMVFEVQTEEVHRETCVYIDCTVVAFFVWEVIFILLVIQLTYRTCKTDAALILVQLMDVDGYKSHCGWYNSIMNHVVS